MTPVSVATGEADPSWRKAAPTPAAVSAARGTFCLVIVEFPLPWGLLMHIMGAERVNDFDTSRQGNRISN